MESREPFLKKCLFSISYCGLGSYVEGIFRIPGGVQVIQDIKNHYNQGSFFSFFLLFPSLFFCSSFLFSLFLSFFIYFISFIHSPHSPPLFCHFFSCSVYKENRLSCWKHCQVHEVASISQSYISSLPEPSFSSSSSFFLLLFVLSFHTLFQQHSPSPFFLMLL